MVVADIKAEVRQALAGITDAWRQGRPETLMAFFHDRMVIVGPGLKELCRGRDACVRSYVDFLSSAEVLEYEESNHTIEVWGDTAVATYDWRIDWRSGEKIARERGQDEFVFLREEEHWRAIWRAVLFSPETRPADWTAS